MVPPMSRPQAPPAATRKQRRPASILYYFHLMNDNTLALTTLRDVVWRLIFYAGAIGRPVHQKPARKESGKGALWEVLFWTLDDRGKGSKSGESK
jgi:hypothetical protein